jgi:hypothetical protein
LAGQGFQYTQQLLFPWQQHYLAPNKKQRLETFTHQGAPLFIPSSYLITALKNYSLNKAIVYKSKE